MLSIDLLIVGTFLIITLAIGLYYSKGITTFQAYAVGNRKMSTTVITLSLIATIYGARALYSKLETHYRQGFYACILDLMTPLLLYVISRFVIVRMKEYVGHLSIAESMGSIYGPTVRVVTGIFGIILAIALLTAQIKIGLDLTTRLFPEIEQFSTHSAVILSGIVIFYASFGGARSVALTDVYQFFLFGLCFPLLTFILLYRAQDPVTGWKKLTEIAQFNIKNTHTICTWKSNLTDQLLYFIIMHTAFFFDSVRIQRFYMASSVQQATKVFNRSVMIRPLLAILFFSVAIALHVGGHMIKPGQHVLNYIIELDYFPGIRGILVTAIFALLMSTVDSNLHVASVLFTNDIWPVVTGWTKRIGKPSLKVARISSVFIGIISVFVVLHTTSVVQLINKATHMYGPVVSVPVCMACFGFRPRTAAVLCSMGINTAIAAYCIYYKGQTISNNQIATSIVWSMLILLASHYLLPKRPHAGWVGIKDSSLLDLQSQTTKRWWQARLQQFTLPFTKQYRAMLFPKKESTFILLGICLIISTIVSLYFIKKDYFFPYVYGYMAVMAMGTILTIYPAFHSYQPGGNKILHWVWPGLLFALIFIANLQFVKLGHCTPMVCALFICNLSLGIVLLSLEVGIAMVGAAMLIHSYIPPNVHFWSLFLAGYKEASTVELLFATALVVAAVVGLGTYKYLRDKAEAKFKVMDITRTYEHRIALEAIYHQANWSRLDMTYGSQLLDEMDARLQSQEKLSDDIHLLVYKLHQFNNLLLRRVKAEASLELNQKLVQSVAIEPVIAKAYGTIRGLGEPMQLLLRNQTAVKQLLADPALFECFLILNLWEISKCQQATDHMVTLTIADTTLRYDYVTPTSSDQSALTLPALAFCFSTDTTVQNIRPVYDITDTLTPTYIPKTEKQFYQVESRQIVQAHGGYTEIIEVQEVLTCLYILPVAGKKVMRFKTYDPVNLTNGIRETAESIAQEKELVALFTAKTSLSKATAAKTIAFIKNAHGLVARKSGAPYYTHPMAVAKILLEATQDPVTLLAGLLHDIVEDTPVTLNQIEVMYGGAVASIVDKVTHYNTNGYPWKLEDEVQKNILDQCKDIGVVQVKLADRLHNLRTLYAHEAAVQQRIVKETIDFYIPWGKKHKILEQWLAEMQSICKGILSQKA